MLLDSSGNGVVYDNLDDLWDEYMKYNPSFVSDKSSSIYGGDIVPKFSDIQTGENTTVQFAEFHDKNSNKLYKIYLFKDTKKYKGEIFPFYYKTIEEVKANFINFHPEYKLLSVKEAEKYCTKNSKSNGIISR